MTQPLIVRDVLPNGLRLLTERMPHVRSVSIGVWLARGSRHEPQEQSGIAHFVEHMLFKGTATRSAEDIAQTIDSIGGQMDAFTAKEYASYYIKVLDEHLPLAVDVLVRHRPASRRSAQTTSSARRRSSSKRSRWSRTRRTISSTSCSPRTSGWIIRSAGRFSGRKRRSKRSTRDGCATISTTSTRAPQHDHRRGRQHRARSGCAISSRRRSGPCRPSQRALSTSAPRVEPRIIIRNKELEQSHVCLGTSSYQQDHEDRYSSYVLNTVLGGSMSSRLFQNVREKRGLAYAVFSGLSAYRDAGSMTIYAGCANDAIGELIDVVIAELQRMKDEPLPESELRRAKDHLKGSLMLNLESTSSRMSHLARQEIYFDRQFGSTRRWKASSG